MTVCLWQAIEAHEGRFASDIGSLAERNFDLLMLGFGALLALSLALTVHLWQSARRRARTAEMMNLMLEAEITQRRRIERELQAFASALQTANQRLEKTGAQAEAASRAKSEFLANMSHEIRTPMTAILGFAELLTERDQELDDLQRREACETIRRNGCYLLEIINDILDLSKIEAGELTIERIPCSPAQLVNEVALMMRTRAHAKGIELRVEFDPSTPQTICSDPTRLRQGLVNLVSNAVKFTHQGAVAVRVALAREPCGRSQVYFDVTDTGIGISPEHIKTIFEPFRQADSSTTRRYGGTGLGLAITRHIAGLLGGDLIVTSTPGQGSTFTMRVDCGEVNGAGGRRAEGAARAVIPADMSTLSGAGLNCRVLLVEDGVDNQRLIRFVLEEAGAEVALAGNGQEGVEQAAAAVRSGAPFDIILMDMQMPVMDGQQAARTLRQQGIEVPIVALTAHAMDGDRERCLVAGCNAYLTKPISRARLLQAVRHALKEAAPVAAPG
jgi:signal transduction histidine kinase/ActR/RegA family two-component response regulator